MNTQPLLLDSMKISPVTTPRSSFIESKNRTSSIDNPIVGKAPRVYPQLVTISSDSVEKELKNATEESIHNEKNEKKEKKEKKEKEKIPKALREQVWLHYAKKNFEIKCPVVWCENKISPFDFHVGHNIAEVNGGTLDINNLKPICCRCNLSMGSQYTIDEWNKLAKPSVSLTKKIKCNIM